MYDSIKTVKIAFQKSVRVQLFRIDINNLTFNLWNLRYIAVCHPIKGKVICTESRAKRVIFCVFIICVSITLPTPFEWVVYEHTDPLTNSTRMKVAFSELGQNATYKSIYYHTTVFLFVLLPLVLLVIFNSFLIRSVHQSTKQRRKMVMGKGKDFIKQNRVLIWIFYHHNRQLLSAYKRWRKFLTFLISSGDSHHRHAHRRGHSFYSLPNAHRLHSRLHSLPWTWRQHKRGGPHHRSLKHLQLSHVH